MNKNFATAEIKNDDYRFRQVLVVFHEAVELVKATKVQLQQQRRIGPILTKKTHTPQTGTKDGVE